MSRRINPEKINRDLNVIAKKLLKVGIHRNLCIELQLLAEKINDDIKKLPEVEHEPKPDQDVHELPTPTEL